jgi:hypothetical protein
MTDAREENPVILQLRRECQKVLERASAFHNIALQESSAERAAIFREQARFEGDKARGYMRHANFLEKLTSGESKKVA